MRTGWSRDSATPQPYIKRRVILGEGGTVPPQHSTTRSPRPLGTARRTARTPGAGQDRGTGPATTLRAPLGPQRGAPHTPKHPKIPQNTPKPPGPPLLPQEAAKRESRGLGPGRGPLRERRGRPEGGAGPGDEGGGRDSPPPYTPPLMAAAGPRRTSPHRAARQQKRPGPAPRRPMAAQLPPALPNGPAIWPIGGGGRRGLGGG